MKLAALATILLIPTFALAEENTLVSHPIRTVITWTGLVYPAPYFAVRCAQVVNCGNGLKDHAGCFTNIGAMGTSAQMENSRAYMLEDLEKLGQDKRAIRALRIIDFMAGQTGRKFNLWTVTLNAFSGNKREAMKFLAAFFQAREFETDRLSPDVNALKNSMLKKLIAGMTRGDIQSYPPGIKPNKTGIYHFYAIGEIAAKMKDVGISHRFAAALPFVMNEGYEKAFTLLNSKNDYEDIYSGYAGVSFALSSDKETFSGADFDTFKLKYASDGVPAVSRFLKRDLGGTDNFCNDLEPYIRESTQERSPEIQRSTKSIR